MAEDTSISDFIGRMKNANENADTLLGYEPSVGKIVLYISMAAACDCADATDPENAVESDIEVIKSVTELAHSKIDKWSGKELKFDGKPEFAEEEWLDTFVDAQGFLHDTVDAHLKVYGNTPDGRMKAFNEVSNILVYMISAICARCENPEEVRRFSEESIRKTYDFIREKCTLVSEEEIENKKQQHDDTL